MNRKTLSAAVAAALLAVGGAAAYAAKAVQENDAVAALAHAKVTLVEAVGVAEQHARGKAAGAHLDDEGGTLAFEVEVVQPDRKVLEVRVDAASGKLLSTREDKADGAGHKDDD